MQIDWDALWAELTGRFSMGEESIHGPEHWRRVERHAMELAEHSGGDLLVVRLFAVFHDVCRVNDGRDDDHGARGAEQAVAPAWSSVRIVGCAIFPASLCLHLASPVN